MALSAWRWRLTAQRLGAPIRFGEALREYYVATFLNQVLPGGVMGDAARAWRHARLSRTEAMDGAPVGLAAWHAVLIERASGQLALLGVVLATLLVSPELRAGAGISKDVVLLGMGAYFELWDAQVYAAQEAEAMKADMPDVFKDFSF